MLINAMNLKLQMSLIESLLQDAPYRAIVSDLTYVRVKNQWIYVCRNTWL